MSTSIPETATTTRSLQCWCGNNQLVAFSDDYACCEACETLICRAHPRQPDPRVRDDATDFYGWDYFHKHQQDANKYPSIETRARTDLSERCVFWLNALVQYKLPPAKVLELGSAHGGFVATMRQAGFDAMGSDLSPSIVQMARETFDVPILHGPVEDLQIEPASLDVIAMMDVIEHMPDPVGTMKHCVTLLKPNGLILLQTPRYSERRTLAELTAENDKFVEQLRAGEHLHLFSQKSIAHMFASIGAPHIEFLPAIFGFYDMFCVVSQKKLVQTSVEARNVALQSTPGGRVAQAMLDAENRYRDLLAKHRALITANTELQNRIDELTSFEPLKLSA